MNLYKPYSGNHWAGRVDTEETRPALRWHQQIVRLDLEQRLTITPDTAGSLALLGFQCDAGVRRNKGRPGAAEGPNALRAGLANASTKDTCIFDAGDIFCISDELEAAQCALADKIDQLLKSRLRPVVVGGGHEVAWASFQGLIPTLKEKNSRLGIINFDAHLDLRAPTPQGSSGTPFRQINEWCVLHKQPFNYCVLGVNPSANTQALFEYAEENNVQWLDDIQFESYNSSQMLANIKQFLINVDALYITVCLDVFNAAFAPGVSAPAALGITPAKMLSSFKLLLAQASAQGKPVLLLDIAELCPTHDRDNITAKLGARIVWEYQQFLQQSKEA